MESGPTLGKLLMTYMRWGILCKLLIVPLIILFYPSINSLQGLVWFQMMYRNKALIFFRWTVPLNFLYAMGQKINSYHFSLHRDIKMNLIK